MDGRASVNILVLNSCFIYKVGWKRWKLMVKNNLQYIDLDEYYRVKSQRG